MLCIATSGQKWLHFKGAISYSQDDYPVQLEETRIYVDVAKLKQILVLVEDLYTVFPRQRSFPANITKPYQKVRG